MNKKSKIFSLIIFFSFLFFFLKKITPLSFAIEISPSPYFSSTTKQEYNDEYNDFFDFFKTLFSLPNVQITPVSCLEGNCPLPTPQPILTLIIHPQNDNQLPTIYQSPIFSLDSNQEKFNYVYYNQCDPNFGNNPLPQGCTICKSGCGPTTVAMILSSFLDQSYNPKKTISYYQDLFEKNKNNYTDINKNPFYVGCNGSYIQGAKEVLNSLGFITTKYLVYNLAKSDLVAQDFKNYLDGGWTILALANFCEKGCGHFIWVVDVDQNDNIWAYDPYYGRKQPPPLNENRYYPFPKYRYAFGVKKVIK